MNVGSCCPPQFFYGWTALVGQGLFIVEIPRSHSFRQPTLGRSPLDDGSVRHRNLYLTHNIDKRQTTMPTVKFEPAIPPSER